MFVIQRMRKDKVTFLKEYDGSMGLIVVGWQFSLILLSYRHLHATDLLSKQSELRNMFTES